MLIADARSGLVRHATVHLNGEPVQLVRRAVALWNGGPGYVVQLYTDAAGKIVIDDSGTRCAEVIRFGWSVRVEGGR